jgi:hypothetical protein
MPEVPVILPFGMTKDGNLLDRLIIKLFLVERIKRQSELNRAEAYLVILKLWSIMKSY